MSAKRTVRIGFLGFGTVGEGAYRMLHDNEAAITAKVGLPFEVVKIGVKDLGKARSAPADLFTTDLDSIVDHAKIDVILELMGGIDPAGRLVEKAIRNGKNVVTANKELMAKSGSHLVTLAQERQLDMHYEAAVGGGIPIIQPLKHQLAGNDVLKMMGILNGTSNYILSKIAKESAAFDAVLQEAQAKGYAEADPTNDIDGFDTLYKISILASIVFGKQVNTDNVYREGIRNVTPLDMKHAKDLGYVIKLLGIVEAQPHHEILVRVHPTMLPMSHPLAKVDDVYNGLWIHGDFVGDLMFSGRGAGANPTASAVIGDLIDVGRNLRIRGPGSAIPYGKNQKLTPMANLKSRYYVRLIAIDRPKGLGEIALIFGDHDVSLAAMDLRPMENGQAELVFLTHPALEKDLQRCIETLRSMDGMQEVVSCIRVEE